MYNYIWKFVKKKFHKHSFLSFLDKLQHCRQDLSYFCICIAVLSTISSYPVCANPVPSTESTIRVSDMTFSNKLSNPCTLIEGSSLQRSTLAEETQSNRRNVFNHMKAKASLLKESAETILRTVSAFYYLITDLLFMYTWNMHGTLYTWKYWIN